MNPIAATVAFSLANAASHAHAHAVYHVARCPAYGAGHLCSTADLTAWIDVSFTLPFMLFMPVYGRLGDGLGTASAIGRDRPFYAGHRARS